MKMAYRDFIVKVETDHGSDVIAEASSMREAIAYGMEQPLPFTVSKWKMTNYSLVLSVNA